MKNTENRSVYKNYRDAQIEWASADDLLLTLAQKLIRAKEKMGTNLFWDEDEEQFLRDYIKNAEAAALN